MKTPFTIFVILNVKQYFIQNILVRLSYMGRDISVGIATRYRLDGPGIESR